MDTVYEDRTLACRDCGEGFIFSGGEQRFFAEKGLLNVPQRCSTCRANAKRPMVTANRMPRTRLKLLKKWESCLLIGREV